MLIIPLAVTPSQIVNINLSGVLFQLNVYQKSTGVYADVYQSASPLVTGVLCHDRNVIVRDAYLGFPGDLTFIDQQDKTDPVYTGFGTRYIFAYLSPADLANMTSLTL